MKDLATLEERMQFVKGIAERMAQGMGGRHTDDLVGQAYLILVELMPRWDPARSSLRSFLGQRVPFRLLDYARVASPFKRSHFAAIQHGRYPMVQIGALGPGANQQHVAPPTGFEEGPAERELRALTRRLLPGRQGLAFELWHFDGLTMRQIGHCLSICESRVSQLIKDAKFALARRLPRSVLADSA